MPPALGVRSLLSRKNLVRVVVALGLFVFFQALLPHQSRLDLEDYLSTSDENFEDGLVGVDNVRPTPPPKAFVVASMKGDDTSWLQDHFPDWQANIYVMNDPKADLTVAKNKGRESAAYLTYLIDNYEDLPEVMLFLHALRYQWHNEDPMYDGVPIIQNLQLPYVVQEGYVNLRCTWVIGCPNEIRVRPDLSVQNPDDHAQTEMAYAKGFSELFPNTTVPNDVGVHCGAQFALSREKVWERPKEDYIRYRKWLWATDMPDNVSGRILEYSYHMIFGKPPIHCPRAEDCFCKKFGLCNLTCPDRGSCEKRYKLPRFATIPQGWPEKGPGKDGWPEKDWYL